MHNIHLLRNQIVKKYKKYKMKKIAILFMSLVVLSTTLLAGNDETGTAKNAVMTTSLSGKVLDKVTGEALAGVKVSVQGSEKSVYTDFEGNFEINGIVPGNVELCTTYISYKSNVEKVNVDLNKSNSVDVKIESITE